VSKPGEILISSSLPAPLLSTCDKAKEKKGLMHCTNVTTQTTDKPVALVK
jgi:hypothetical protein